MTQIDDQIGRFRAHLEEHDALKDTWIVFASDHGELRGDHGLFCKALPYEGSAHVPLIIRPPEEYKGRHGLSLDELVELRDILPTILEADRGAFEIRVR